MIPWAANFVQGMMQTSQRDIDLNWGQTETKSSWQGLILIRNML
jgi:hypothetical protein